MTIDVNTRPHPVTKGRSEDIDILWQRRGLPDKRRSGESGSTSAGGHELRDTVDGEGNGGGAGESAGSRGSQGELTVDEAFTGELSEENSSCGSVGRKHVDSGGLNRQICHLWREGEVEADAWRIGHLQGAT